MSTLRTSNKSHPSTGFYRPDIDGIRAIAVCLVIASHLQDRFVRGGFIGVDVFFVISGFLISSILLREFELGRFSIAGFYERRIRRILPALIAVLVFTSAVAWLQFFPLDLIDYARSLIGATLSVSNIYFLTQSGYFAPYASRRPLLHTWSLGVEEQFYLLFPLLLLLIYRYGKRWLTHAIIALAVISFLASAILVFSFPNATFYLAPLRAWELLMGTIVAMLGHFPVGKWLRHAAGIVGLLMIFVAALLYTKFTPFPGATALVPCAGTALLLVGGMERDGLTYRLLSLKPLVLIGLMSYSLYLWHWPIISLRNNEFKEPMTLSIHAAQALVLVEIFVVGALSWRFIETPFRKGLSIARRPLFAYAAVASMVLVAFGVFVLTQGGIPSRFSPESRRLASYVLYGGDHAAYRANHCFIAPEEGGTFEERFDKTMCLPRSSKPTYLIAGSSHAAHLWIGLSTVFTDINWQQITSAGCRPTIGDNPGELVSCTQMRKFLFKDYLPTHSIDGIVLSAEWIPRTDDVALGKTLDYLALRHIKIFVVGPVVEYDDPLPQLLAMEVRKGDARGSGISSHLMPEPLQADVTLSHFVSRYSGVTYISLLNTLCPNHVCYVYTKEGIPIQSDTAHFTRAGSTFVAERLKQSGLFNRQYIGERAQ